MVALSKQYVTAMLRLRWMKPHGVTKLGYDWAGPRWVWRVDRSPDAEGETIEY